MTAPLLSPVETPCRIAVESGVDWWTSNDVEDRHRAARICRGCPLLVECAQYAVDSRATAGIYAATDMAIKHQRLKLRRAMAQRAAVAS